MDDRELKKLLEKNLEISKKTLAITKKLRRDQWYNRVINVIKWLAILGVLAWGYTQIQPFIGELLGIIESIQDIGNKLPGF